MGYGLGLRTFSWSPANLNSGSCSYWSFPSKYDWEETALISTLGNLYGSLPRQSHHHTRVTSTTDSKITLHIDFPYDTSDSCIKSFCFKSKS